MVYVKCMPPQEGGFTLKPMKLKSRFYVYPWICVMEAYVNIERKEEREREREKLQLKTCYYENKDISTSA